MKMTIKVRDTRYPRLTSAVLRRVDRDSPGDRPNMKMLIIAMLAFATRWFVNDACVTKIERIFDWRVPATWAAAAVLCIVGVIFLFP